MSLLRLLMIYNEKFLQSIMYYVVTSLEAKITDLSLYYILLTLSKRYVHVVCFQSIFRLSSLHLIGNYKSFANFQVSLVLKYFINYIYPFKVFFFISFLNNESIKIVKKMPINFTGVL